MHNKDDEELKAAQRREVRVFLLELALCLLAAALIIVFDDTPEADMSGPTIKIEDIAIDVGKDQAAARAAAAAGKGD